MNHSGTGAESIYGVIWLLAGVVIALFTWVNYRSYAVTHPGAPGASAQQAPPRRA
jgi:hypothetical protein